MFGAAPVPVPEPASSALAGIGIAAIVVSRRLRLGSKDGSFPGRGQYARVFLVTGKRSKYEQP
ncbi:MAG: PEP-CTERM sorting domain-containing protein [Bryobacteraceae bacterium]